MPRRFTSPDEAEKRHNDGLPLDKPVALYYRQSTEGQIGNISTTIQTVDMHENLQRMGWRKDQIKLIDVDGGKSGRLRIDEREGMNELFGLIVNKQVGAVAAQDEDRFFRDDTMIQVDTFIYACKQANVKVITPNIIYDFAHPQMGTFYQNQFRWKCQMGADYINTQVIGKLAGARKFLMRVGKWAGANIPLGYMVDLREKIEGQPNPTYRMFVPFEPFALVVREYFKIFIEFGGDIARTHHYIRQRRVFFPEATKPPSGFKVKYNLKPAPDGYYPTKTGLRQMFTNPIYIGHWLHNNAVVQWNNHEPIVPEDLFWRAFNYLSPLGLDGKPNPNYRPVKHHSRPTVEDKRDVDRPLCAGLIFGQVDDQLLPMSIIWSNLSKQYAYALLPYDRSIGTNNLIWKRKAHIIDEAISYHLVRRLKETFNPETWEQTIEWLESRDEPEDRLRLEYELQSVENQIQRVKLRLEVLETADLIRDAENEYRILVAQRSRIQAELATKQTHRIEYEHWKQLGERYHELIDEYNEGTRDEKHSILQLFVNRIVLVKPDSYKPAIFRIEYKDGGEEMIVVRNNSRKWTYAEIQAMRAMIEAGYTPKQVQEAFSTHPASSVRQLYRALKVENETCSCIRFLSNYVQYL